MLFVKASSEYLWVIKRLEGILPDAIRFNDSAVSLSDAA